MNKRHNNVALFNLAKAILDMPYPLPKSLRTKAIDCMISYQEHTVSENDKVRI